MFHAKDPHDIARDAAAIDHRAIHELFDPFAESGSISPAVCNEICAEFQGLIDVIKADYAKPEDFWHAFRAQFGFAGAGVTPMNAANLCPEPSAILRAANLLRVEYNRNVAQQTRTARGVRVRQLELARQYLAKGVNLRDPKDLAMIRNSSEGNNAISCGFRDWRRTGNPAERDNVVIWSDNHPTNLESWWLRAQWEGRERGLGPEQRLFDVIPVRFDPAGSEAEIARAFIEKIDHRTRFVSYTETTNGSGVRMPESVIARIWQHVEDKRYDCHIHVDGTMAWGARSINLAKPYCHSFVSSAHKWFLGPKETAMFYVDRSRARRLAPSIFAYDYRIEVGPWREMPDNALRFELLGQRDDVNLITLTLTQMMWLALGPRDPAGRVAELAGYLLELLDRTPGRWRLVTPADPSRRSAVIRVHAPQGGRSKTLYDWIYESPEHGIGGSGDAETFRLCPHVYNTRADVERAVAGMNAWYESR